jgi:integration host factor subunit beta
MIKPELVDRILVQNPHLSRGRVEKLVNAILDGIASAIACDDRVELRGFGAFSARVRTAHLGCDPRTGKDVAVPRKVVPYFKPAKEMRLRVNPTSEETPNKATGR